MKILTLDLLKTVETDLISIPLTIVLLMSLVYHVKKRNFSLFFGQKGELEKYEHSNIIHLRGEVSALALVCLLLCIYMAGKKHIMREILKTMQNHGHDILIIHI